MVKTCKKCNIEKSLSEFSKQKANKDGIRSRCKSCEKIYKDKYNLENKHINKAYAVANKGKIKVYKKEHSIKNKDSIRQYKRQWETHKRATSLQFKIAQNLRTRLREAIKNKAKSGSAVSDLGCSIEFLMNRLQANFTTDMSWENYGFNTWHIDHIIPLSYFNLEDSVEFKLANHYLNLQPMGCYHNWSKSDNLPVNYLQILESIKRKLSEQV